uniref:Ribosomal RNA-processing protein 8 n=1 Tax=Panagrolaimus davidi TaxID=227884 RepID=A0A914Q4H9_9BILA
MSEENEVVLSETKKRKRPWRAAVRKAAKKAKISELKSTPSNENEEILKDIKEKFKLKNKKRKEKKKALKVDKNKPKDKKEVLVDKLTSSRFRYLNEQLYTMDSADAKNLFQEDDTAFQAYHKGYRSQVEKWPINPVDIIIKHLRKLPAESVIVDLGCGDAKIAKTLGKKNTVHSFDLVSNSPLVIACDMANIPLEDDSADVVVFCLSLMGSNLADFIREANRILKTGGVVKIAEVWSRFKNLKKFLRALEQMGFKVINEKLLNDYFELITLKKIGKIEKKRPLGLTLEPCFYKKR